MGKALFSQVSSVHTGGKGSYPGWEGETVPTLDGRGRGYLPWMGGGEGTYLGWEGERVPTLDGRGTGYLTWMGGGKRT